MWAALLKAVLGDREKTGADREMPRKNLVIEALEKLMTGDVRAQSQRLVNRRRGRAIVERLVPAITRYHANAITTVQVLEELIAVAKDIRAARSRGEEAGLSDEEIAFNDVLAENESARTMMGSQRYG